MASNSPPPPPTTQRRFLPQPVETSIRSSKRSPPTAPEHAAAEPAFKVDTMAAAAAAKPRRFLPQPVEESVRSSRKKRVEHVEDALTQKSTIDAKDESVASKPTARRFAPQPVETSARTSRRNFAPEPVEVSQRSSKQRNSNDNEASAPTKTARKFAVEPIETSTITRRRRRTDDSSNESPEGSSSESSSKVSSRKSTGSRRFSPELIETARGEFRHVKKDTDHSDSPRLKSPSSPDKAHSSDSEVPESKFSAAALAKRHHEEHRRHSYCVPNLPSIESDSGGEDSSSSPSQSSASTELPSPHKLDQIPEGDNASYLDYVWSLADRRRLQEQAMAAYINEVPHQYVSHFAAEDDDDDDATGVMSGKEGADPKTFRRSSQDELDLEMLSMRKHHEQLEQAKQDFAQDTAGASRFSAAALAARHHLNIGHPKPPAQENNKKKRAKAGDSEFASMRAAASPPMLGADIKFPYTISPRMTRCDVDQAPRPRRADSDEDVKTPESESQLWSASIGVQNKAPVGLWMGLCQKGPDEQSRPTTPIKSGLQTPAVEGANPFEMWSPNRGNQTPGRRPGPLPRSDRSFLSLAAPRTPTTQDEFANSIDKKLEMEKRIDEEFSNRVVTQIYNYLSLGYPSLARPFDDELSKISRIPVEDLRKDDQLTAGKVRGYVGAPEGEGEWEVDESDALRGCRRWEALRIYVREWARQSPNFASERAKLAGNDPNISALKLKRGEAWGATVRKGSWAQ